MNWKVTFYNSKVEAQTLEFPPGILANFLHIAEMIETLGPNLGNSMSDHWVLAYTKFVQKGKKELGVLCTVRLRKKKL